MLALHVQNRREAGCLFLSFQKHIRVNLDIKVVGSGSVFFKVFGHKPKALDVT